MPPPLLRMCYKGPRVKPLKENVSNLSEIKDSLPDSSQPWSFFTACYSFIWDWTAPAGECGHYRISVRWFLFEILMLKSDHPKGSSYSQNAKETMLMNHDSWFVTHDSSKTSLFTDTTEGRKNCFLSVSFFFRLINREMLCDVRYHFCFVFLQRTGALNCKLWTDVIIFIQFFLLFYVIRFFFYLVMWHLSRLTDIWLTDCL